MEAKLVVLVALVGVASAGIISTGPALSYGHGGSAYSSQSIISHAAPIAYAAPAIHAAPVAYAAQAIHAAPISYAAPVAKLAYAAPIAHKTEIDYVDAHPSYKFEYGVHDAHTGDVKSQSEIRDGDVVKGSYSLVEPDGSKRIVEYTADDHNGFNAVVHREQNAHPQVVHKVIAAPVAKVAYAAPLLHSAPLISSYGGHY